jgi:DNA invertase Pin-like site-specific DNA recombinase
MAQTFAYLRVSTDAQDLNNQMVEIQKYAKDQNLTIDRWIRVEMSSRKGLKERRITDLLEALRKGDRLIVSELSRLARSLREIHNVVFEIARKKAHLHIIKQALVTKGANDMATKIVINSFAMASEIERDLISQRTISGLARVRAEGKKLGNPKIALLNRRRTKSANAFAENLRSTISSFISNGYTQRQIADQLNLIGVRTNRGSEFKLMTVQRLLKRLGLSTRCQQFDEKYDLLS